MKRKLKSLARLLISLLVSVIKRDVRRVVLHGFCAFYLSEKNVTNTSLNPGSKKVYSFEERKTAIENAIYWILHAQKGTSDKGICAEYSLQNGWRASYPETTGYLIPSLLNFGIQRNNKKVIEIALAAANWLLEIQKPSGGWQSGRVDQGREEVVFNTGQVVRGLIASYKYTKVDKYLKAATKACDWLCDIQHEEGYWDTQTYLNLIGAYDSFVAAPIMSLYRLTGNPKYKEKALRNVEWVINSMQKTNGWFSKCDNREDESEPLLHTIAYTTDGLLDCGIILQDNQVIAAAKKTADILYKKFGIKKYLVARYNSKWKGTVSFIAPFALAQVSIIWLKLYKLTTNIQYLNSAMKINDFLIFVQYKNPNNLNLFGAIPGSYPIWESMFYPNWAAKFFIDALMMEQEFLSEII